MDNTKSKGYHLAVKTILTVAAQIADPDERRAFLSSVRICDGNDREIELFLKRLAQ